MSYPYEKFYDLIDELQKVKDDGINFPGWIFVKSKDLEEVIEAMFDMTKAAFNNADTIVKREREILQEGKPATIFFTVSLPKEEISSYDLGDLYGRN